MDERLIRQKGFNPHRPFRAGATPTNWDYDAIELMFQSSPALSGRCNGTYYIAHIYGHPRGRLREPPTNTNNLRHSLN